MRPVGADDGSVAGLALQRASPRLRRRLAAAAGAVLVVTAASLVLLWPRGYTPPPPPGGYATTENMDATVTAVESRDCGGASCLDVTVRVDGGPDAGRTVVLNDMQFSSSAARPGVGDGIVLSRARFSDTGEVVYGFVDVQRRTPLLILAGVFALFAVAVGRLRGLAALAGLVITWAVLTLFLIPALLNGQSPIPVALTAASAILLVVLYVAHGVNARSTVALLGTVAALLATGVLAVAFTSLTRLTGLAVEEVAYIRAQGADVDAHGLLLAGIIIATLGALTDITVTQSAIVWEVHAANPARGIGALYRSGMRAGRDHIASIVDTLVLAYAGASLPLLLLLALAGDDLGAVVAGEVVAAEIVSTLVGSIGLVASVPVTTALAALVVHRSTPGFGTDPDPA